MDGCINIVHAKGWCNKHYLKLYKQDENYKPNRGQTHNPLYIIWWQRKKDNLLCDKWLNFEEFIKDVSPRPVGDFLFIRIKKGLFAPDNFQWKEHLRKRDNESFRQWWARKRKHRILLNPTLESDRNLKRKYGLTKKQYEEKLNVQNGVCAICSKPETSVDGRTERLKNLAVDHNHKTNKIRGLLCWRCNGTIGKIEEDLDLLDKIKSYLVKYQ